MHKRGERVCGYEFLKGYNGNNYANILQYIQHVYYCHSLDVFYHQCRVNMAPRLNDDSMSALQRAHHTVEASRTRCLI